MAETSKLEGDSVSLSKIEFGEMGIQQIAISDQGGSPMGGSDMSDSFIVDIENLAQGALNDNISANSRISVKLQRNMSRKGSQRGEKNTPTHGSSNGKPGGALSSGDCDMDKSATPAPVVSLGTKDSISKQPQQTITIKTENRCGSARKYLKQRPSFLDPRRVVLFFATLSSMGTILLIYLTLAINKFGGDSFTDAH